ncbi:LytR/AlgR family response regulator transcription factor [Longitalea luteola]|uniref:LytR/AlgR family response regulator transcription factor n=1 Tax=Longitalea luteola TaxID=2812563 RepID=UPI001A96D508|nr:response regulator [Longitalea luteola]
MNDKVKIMIVEDETIVAMDLSLRLQKEGYEVVGIASNSDDAIEIYTEHKPDLVLMDINIKGKKDGIETAAALKKIQEVPLIFLTAFSQNEYITRAKTVNPSAYLVKPFNNDSLHTSIQIAIHNFAVPGKPTHPQPVVEAKDDTAKETLLFFNNYFFVKHNYRFNKFSLDELLFAESDNNYIRLVTTKKKIALRLSLQYLADKFNHPALVRVHRGFIVNIRNIDSFNEEEIIIGPHQIPIGRNYKDDFLKSFRYL